jgi:serine protease inhibitor
MTFARMAAVAASAAAMAAGSASLRAAEPVTFADFGIRLLQQSAAAAPDRNVVISPLSAGIALSMAYDGATGDTAGEISHALGVEGMTPDQLDAALAGLLRSLRASRAGVDVEIADSAWVDNSRPQQPLPAYVHRLEDSYQASVHAANFRDPSTVGAINRWVSQATHGNITDLLDRLDADAALYLCNAVYFKGMWQTAFDASKTKSGPFELPDGATQSVQRMTATRSFDYFETPDIQAVRLPYQGGYSMEVFLPSRGMGLDRFERDMTSAQWMQRQETFAERKGTLELPRFTLRWKSSLKPMLQAMGMRAAFAPGARFDRMYPPPTPVYIEDVVQATYLQVDERGTTASAATGVTMGIAAISVQMPRPFSMIVDRPFFCAIVDDATGAPLFFATVDDPRG